jgi:CubicO group peptidase (beta-lactamase class C family)
MRAFELIAAWPVDNVAAAVIDRRGEIHFYGDESREFRLASVSKVITAWAVLVACEEGTLSLADAVGQDGCTVQHLLAHAGGYAFEGGAPITDFGPDPFEVSDAKTMLNYLQSKK